MAGTLSFLKRQVFVLCGHCEALVWAAAPQGKCCGVLRGLSHAGCHTLSGFSLPGSTFLANTLWGCEAGPLSPMFREVLGSKLPQPQTKGKVPRFQKLGGGSHGEGRRQCWDGGMLPFPGGLPRAVAFVFIEGTCAQRAFALGVRV